MFLVHPARTQSTRGQNRHHSSDATILRRCFISSRNCWLKKKRKRPRNEVEIERLRAIVEKGSALLKSCKAECSTAASEEKRIGEKIETLKRFLEDVGSAREQMAVDLETFVRDSIDPAARQNAEISANNWTVIKGLFGAFSQSVLGAVAAAEGQAELSETGKSELASIRAKLEQIRIIFAVDYGSPLNKSNPVLLAAARRLQTAIGNIRGSLLRLAHELRKLNDNAVKAYTEKQIVVLKKALEKLSRKVSECNDNFRKTAACNPLRAHCDTAVAVVHAMDTAHTRKSTLKAARLACSIEGDYQFPTLANVLASVIQGMPTDKAQTRFNRACSRLDRRVVSNQMMARNVPAVKFYVSRQLDWLEDLDACRCPEATPTPESTPTTVPDSTATPEPTATQAPTATAPAGATPTATNTPQATVSLPDVTATSTPTPVPSSTVAPEWTPTSTPTATSPTVVTATPTVEFPEVTATETPSVTQTVEPEATHTPGIATPVFSPAGE